MEHVACRPTTRPHPVIPNRAAGEGRNLLIRWRGVHTSRHLSRGFHPDTSGTEFRYTNSPTSFLIISMPFSN